MICYENLKPLYDNCLTNKKACLGEQVNKSLDMMKQNSQPLFIPSIHFMAAPKQNEQVGLLKDYANQLFKSGHFTHEFEFSNRIGHKCLEMKRDQQINVLCGSYTGIKTNKGKPVLLDDLMEESMIDLRKDLYGIIIPRDELLLRTKHQWFAVLSEDEAIHTNACVSKLLFKAAHKHYQTFSVEKQSAITL